MTRNEAVAHILGSGNQIFSVEFQKRTTGELRQMTGRLGVKKHLKGGPPAYNFTDKGLISCFDMTNQGYRCIPVEALVRVKVNGEWLPVND